eukprot:594668-Alexandrium_andersonii.AAC.1
MACSVRAGYEVPWLHGGCAVARLRSSGKPGDVARGWGGAPGLLQCRLCAHPLYVSCRCQRAARS